MPGWGQSSVAETSRPSSQIPIEPVEDPPVAVDPPVRPAGGGIHVVLVRVEDILDSSAEMAQRDEELLVVGRRAAAIRLGLQHQQRRPYVRDVTKGRLAPQQVDALR